MNIKLTLETLSPLLSASGESTAHIDADVKYDANGFPYVQARTFKGLFRESAQEVIEILGINADVLITLLGDKGCKAGKLRFNNLYIEGYTQITACLKKHKGHDLQAAFVKDYFTEYRRQTKIDTKSGTAEDKSLRTYRLIQAGIKMETLLENVDSEHLVFIKQVLSNIRYMGTRRNRGFGKVKVTSDYVDMLTADANKIQSKNSPSNVTALRYTLTTLEDVVIAKVIGEQNTVNTAHYIPPTAIRGLIAQLLIEKGLTKAHTDTSFQHAVLNGNVRYSPAFLQGTEPIARVFGYDKTADTDQTKAEAFNLFENKSATEESNTLKGVGGFVKANTAIPLAPQTVYSFHSTRMNSRPAGRSTEEDGAIFYYEAIEKGQVFEGQIYSEGFDLAPIYTSLQGEHRIGKSKTAQYAKVAMEVQPFERDFAHIKDEVKADESRYLVFQSPVITYNDLGMAIPSLPAILSELATEGIDIKSHEFIASTEYIESFMGIWQKKTPRELAYEIGSTLKITFAKDTAADVLQKIEKKGIGARKAEGYGAVKWQKLSDTLPRMQVPSNENTAPTTFKGFGADAPSLLQLIWDTQKNKEKTNETLTEAVTIAVKKAKLITNSLASRLLESLQHADAIARIESEKASEAQKNEVLKTVTLNEWQRFLHHIKDKKQGKKLKETFTWSALEQLEKGTDYWLTLFKTLRTKTKQNDGK